MGGARHDNSKSDAKNVLVNVTRWSSTKELWEKLEEMYQAKSLSNRLYLKEKFHKL